MTAIQRKMRDAARSRDMTTRDLGRIIEANLTVVQEQDPATAEALKDLILDSMTAGEPPYGPPPRHRRHTPRTK